MQLNHFIMLAPRSLIISRLSRFGALAVLNKVTSNLNLKGSGAARSRGREGSALGGFGLPTPPWVCTAVLSGPNPSGLVRDTTGPRRSQRSSLNPLPGVGGWGEKVFGLAEVQDRRLETELCLFPTFNSLIRSPIQ